MKNKLRIIRGLILISMFFMVLIGCSKDDKYEKDETPPVLSITPVDISSVTSIIAFGDDLGPDRKNPAFEYYLNNSGVQVRASCKGIVENVVLNDNFPDYEIRVKLSSNSIWLIVYDHILNVTISEGDHINPGDILGTVGVGNRTEFQVNKVLGPGEDLSYCPFNFGTDEFIQQHKSFTETWCLEETVVP
ncbi:MAG: peptidoglycan DD-metalloendopeptidase family protein [Candidatus Marinimicrobia bacterium]|nr:peptidoglycan DD-metalloendopeptidase family protein [Candidatus Neomarinimicrobiota bacterium]